MRQARGRASQPRGGLEQRVRRVLPLVMVSVAAVVLWCAAFTAAARCERNSANRVIPHVASPDVTRC